MPPQVLSAPKFEPHKSTKPLTEIGSTNFKRSEERQTKRQAFEAELSAKRAAKEAAVKAEAEERARAEAMELAKMRKGLEFKARPVKTAPAFVVQKGVARPLTKPSSPNFATKSRASVRAN